jgi:hypothetical protein
MTVSDCNKVRIGIQNTFAFNEWIDEDFFRPLKEHAGMPEPGKLHISGSDFIGMKVSLFLNLGSRAHHH